MNTLYVDLTMNTEKMTYFHFIMKYSHALGGRSLWS